MALEFLQGSEGGKKEEKWLDPRTWSVRRQALVVGGTLAMVVAAGVIL